MNPGFAIWVLGLLGLAVILVAGKVAIEQRLGGPGLTLANPAESAAPATGTWSELAERRLAERLVLQPGGLRVDRPDGLRFVSPTPYRVDCRLTTGVVVRFGSGDDFEDVPLFSAEEVSAGADAAAPPSTDPEGELARACAAAAQRLAALTAN